MLHRLLYLFTLICVLASLASPAHAAPPTPTPTATPDQPQPGTPEALEARFAEGLDLEQFPPAAPLVVTFSNAMDPASAQPALLTFPYLPGKETWDSDAQTLTFQPQGGFPGGKEVQVFLNTDLRSKDGKAFQDPQYQTLIVQANPRIIAHHPVAPLLETRQPSFSIEFDREMDLESLKAAIQLEPAAPYEITPDGMSIDITITQPLHPGSQIKLSVNTAAMDTTGAALDRPYSWSYRLKPFELSDLVCSKQRIEFHLSYPVQPEGLQQNIIVEPPLQGKWLKKASGNNFYIQPDQELNWAQPYTISFKDSLQDTNGQPLPLIAPVTCIIAPPIISVAPENKESYGGDFDKVEVTFLTAMDRESVINAFSIQPEVPGTTAFRKTGNNSGILTFLPDNGFSSNVYTVTLNPSMRTVDNKAIITDAYQWQFEMPQGWLGYIEYSAAFTDHGPNIQVVDADAPRYLQFASHHYLQKLYFDAYPVDLPKFVQLYRQSFANVNAYWGTPAKISTNDMEQPKSFSFNPQDGVNDLQLPSDLPIGLYILNMRSEKGLLDQIFLVLSRSTITAKLSGTRLFTWTTNINGEVVPDAEMRLYTQTGELMREGKTDQQGIYETNTPSDSTPMLIAARDQEGDITVAGLTGPWRTRQSNDYWYWDQSDSYSDPSPHLMAYIFTDRPIYRPGNTVNYKAILRYDNDMRYTLLEKDQPVKVRLLDARGNLLEEREQHPNDFGTINGDFTLSPEGNLGSYQIEVQALNETIQQSFSVEEYHKPDYSVTILPAKKELVKGETVDLTIEARYFLGQPVANADVTLKFFNYYDQPTIIKGKTGADGRYVYTANTSIQRLMPWYGYDLSYSWGSSLTSAVQAVEVTVSDGSNQPVSSVTTYRVHSAAEGVELDTHGYFKSPGEPFNVDMQVTTYDGKPVADRKVSLVVYGSNQYYYNREVSRVEAVTGADGNAVIPVTLQSVADYKILVQSADSSGEALYNSEWITAYKPGLAWDFNGQDEVTIHAEKDTYRPLERAKLLVRSTFSGLALLTFERGSVIHSRMVNLTAPITELETEIIPEYAPNVYITINAWQDIPYQPFEHTDEQQDYYSLSANRPNSKLRIASVELTVDSTEKQLDVTVESNKTSFAPREEAEFTIQVSRAGEPVQAELAIGLVDDAIYSLKSEPWKAIYPAFYDPRPHSVAAYDSMAITRYMIEEGRGGGGGEALPNPQSPRSEFPDTAIWLPAVVTDAQGKAVVTLTLPDTLTRWRLTVRAVTRNTRVGETAYTIQTQQAVSLRPVFPSVVTQGDRFVLAAYVHNTGETLRTITAELDAPGLTVVDGGKQTVEVKPGQSIPLRWQVQAEDPGALQVTLWASGASGENDAVLGDAIRLPITVQPRATLNVDQRSGQFSGKLDLPVFLPPTATSASNAHLEIYRSMAGDALSGLESLIGYPYGCVEQTMSKALPNAVVGRALKRLGLSNPELDRELPDLIDAGVKKLYGMQHYDGGWGWWTDDVTDPYQTAWVVFGLSLTRDAGYLVDPKVIHRGARALRGLLKLNVPGEENEIDWNYRVPEDDLDPKLKAFMLYSLTLAGEGEEELAFELYQSYPTLDAFSQSALALALHKLGRVQEAGQIISELESTAYRRDGEAYWTGSTEDGEYHQKTMSSETRTAALALEAIQTIHPESSLIGEIVSYLMARKQLNGWGTTNETAFTLLALTGQLEAVKNVTGPTSYRVLVNGKEIEQADWKDEDLSAVVELPGESLAAGLNRLEIIPDIETPLFFSLGVRLYEDAAEVKPAGNMIIQRQYLDGSGNTELLTFEAGQIVKVRLTVTTRDNSTPYVMVEDHLPGGLEALNEGLNTTSREFSAQAMYYYDYYYEGSNMQFNPFMWELLGYNNKEIHDGRVTFFITSMKSKTVTLSYYARALHSGTFTALPAEASAMYNQNLWGRSDTTIMEVH